MPVRRSKLRSYNTSMQESARVQIGQCGTTQKKHKLLSLQKKHTPDMKPSLESKKSTDCPLKNVTNKPSLNTLHLTNKPTNHTPVISPTICSFLSVP